MSRRIAVVLFNLGGPDSLKAVRPFLFNLFNDRAILELPQPFRFLLAGLIAMIRHKTAKAIYAQMGGASPLLSETKTQRAALKLALEARFPDDRIEVFIAMRYWSPFIADAARDVEAFKPDETVLLPLYPQYSTTTTGSSFEVWRQRYKGSGEVHAVCCYPENVDFVSAHVEKILEVCGDQNLNDFRILFSAHGLPEKIIAAGDPYQHQIERSAHAVARRLNITDFRVCYQSRVGPLQWIGPSTIEAINEAGRDGVDLIVTPIAFVSEHSETLVELDRDYREIATLAGVSKYLRAPAVGAEPNYIKALMDIASEALIRPGLSPCGGACSERFEKCPVQRGLAA